MVKLFYPKNRYYHSLIMKTTTLLVIEGRHAEIPSFAADLQKKGFDVQIAQNGSQAVARLKEVSPSLVVINAATLRSTGLRICQSIREKDPKLPIILILESDNDVINKDVADAVLALPFTVQKLVNRIKPLLPVTEKMLCTLVPSVLTLKNAAYAASAKAQSSHRALLHY
jgi:DNA-binding response OmpR family regulator